LDALSYGIFLSRGGGSFDNLYFAVIDLRHPKNDSAKLSLCKRCQAANRGLLVLMI